MTPSLPIAPSLSEGLERWEITFNPVKRWIRGEHQPTIGYILSAPTLEEAKAEAVRYLRIDSPRVAYRFHSAKQIEAV